MDTAAETPALQLGIEPGACPGCGCEPEVVTFYRRKDTRQRVGYRCSCGATVIDGAVIDVSAAR